MSPGGHPLIGDLVCFLARKGADSTRIGAIHECFSSQMTSPVTLSGEFKIEMDGVTLSDSFSALWLFPLERFLSLADTGSS